MKAIRSRLAIRSSQRRKSITTKKTKRPKRAQAALIPALRTMEVRTSGAINLQVRVRGLRKQCSKAKQAQDQGDGDTCPHCLLPVPGSRFLVCDICQLSHHNQCAAITNSVYDWLSKLLLDIGWIYTDYKTLACSLSVCI
jgi:hypothetical protein